MDIHKRLEIFYERLRDARPSSSASESLDMISRILTEVENEFSGIPENPNPGLKSDGRMYPPRQDLIKPACENPQVKNPQVGDLLARTLANYVLMRSNGSITIYNKNWETKFHKGGLHD